MVPYNLLGIRIGKYVNSMGSVSYTEHCSIGEAMNCLMQLKYAEGRVYSEGGLSEYLKLATGGTLSIGVKYIPDDAQKLLFGAKATSTDISPAKGSPVAGVGFTSKDVGNYVGIAWYAPCKAEGGANKYMAVFVNKASFGAPSYSFKTLGESIEFQTPTTTGEFMPATNTDGKLFEYAICDTEADAIAWTKKVLGET